MTRYFITAIALAIVATILYEPKPPGWKVTTNNRTTTIETPKAPLPTIDNWKEKQNELHVIPVTGLPPCNDTLEQIIATIRERFDIDSSTIIPNCR